MKKLSVLGSVILALFIGLQSFAINTNIPLSKEKTSCKIANSKQDGMQINFHFGDVSAINVKTSKGVFTELHMQNAYSTERIGEPRLPAQKRLIVVPFGAEVSASIANISEVQTIKLSDYGITNLLMPKQYDMPKNMKAEDMPFEYKAAAYAAKGFNQSEMVKVEVLGTFRGVRIARVTVEPMRYNPSTNEIQVYSDINVAINYKNADYATTDKIFRSTYSPLYNAPYSAFLNIQDVYDDHPDLMTPNVKMLIVANRMFESTLAPFIEWKTQMGYELTVAYTDNIGSTANDVKTWIHNEYNTGAAAGNAPDFFIIVGDVEQVPASAVGTDSKKKTDLYYASVDGDQFPEMYYSRLSAQNVTQLQNQLDKILYYEKYQIEAPDYLNDVTLIAGADGNWNPIAGQPTVKYGSQNYFNTEHGYTTINEYLSSYSGCYDPERIAVSFINYTAHCSETSWADPNLSISDVNNFSNANKYPVAIGNCCLAADFGTNECIGEAWMRAKDKGAVGYIGSSPSSYWYNDVYWSVGAYNFQSDGAVPSVDETSTGAYDAAWGDTYNVCLSALHFVGNLAVTQAKELGYSFSATTLYYWEAYNTMGDASLMPFHTKPAANTVSHMEIFPIGMNTYEVTAEPNSWVGISKDGVLVGSGYVGTAGSVNVNITPVTSGGNVDIVVTKSQRQPYIASVPATALEGPYVVISESSFEGGATNAPYNSTQKLNIKVKNVGAGTANDVNIAFSITDDYCSIVGNNTISVGTLAANELKEMTAVVDVKIANNVPDQHTFEIIGAITGTDKTNHDWQSKLRFTADAPVVNINSNYTLAEASGGNGNGRLDAGETATITLELKNEGHARAHTGNTGLSTASEHLTFAAANVSTPAMDPDATTTISFDVTAASATPIGTIALVNTDYASNQYTAHAVLPIAIGEIIEDFETGDFSTQFNYGFEGKPWIIANAPDTYEGQYAMRSAENLGNNQSSAVTITYNDCAAGTISFFYKVSSENNYDKLRFYIDGAEQSNWSGEVDWTEASYDVTAGDHVFKWEYKKDVSTVAGSDCAWVDFIKLPSAINPNAVVAAFTAEDNTIAPGESVTFNATTEGATAWAWTFEGGTPASSTEQNPVVQYANIGMYDVTLEVTKGANTSTITKNDFVIVSEFEGLAEMTNASVKFYPNPNNGTFYVDIQGVDDANIYIYNATGHMVYQSENMVMDNSVKQISLDNAAEGVYFMVIANDTQKVVKKIIIK